MDINSELLYEAIHLKHSLEEVRKEGAAAANGVLPDQQREKKEEEESFQQDFTQ